MAQIIPKRTIEDVRFRNDIVDVVSSYITLNKAGGSFKACCPFHKEKTPSFHVNPQRQIYHCFGCGAGGDAFGFIMQQEGVDFVTAVKILAQKAGIELELEEGDGTSSDRPALYRMLGEVAGLYHKALVEHSSAAAARKYLESRELVEESIKSFQIGYAPNRWDAIVSWARKHKHSLELVEKAGLILRKSGSDGKGDFYDRFRNRLMFPILDEQSRTIGFSGRALDSNENAKYVNSPETPVFHKSRILYALDKARRHIVESREAIICEGQIDVIRCHQSGFETAVASQGTAFTEDHIHILRRYADSACIVFDSDKAGQDAAIKSAALFMKAGLAVRVAALPDGEDPDSFICKRGPEAFQAVLDNASSAVAFQIGVLSRRENVDSEIGTMRVARAVLATIGQSPNAVQRAKLVQEAAERLSLPASALQDDLRYAMHRERRRPGRRDEEKPLPKAATVPQDEMELCEHIVHVADCPELAPLVRKYLPLEVLSDSLSAAIVAAALESFETGRNLQEIISEKADASPELQQLAAKVQMAPAKITGNEFSSVDAVQDLILRFWRKKLTRERAEIEMQADEKSVERRIQITHDLKSLKTWDHGASVIEMEL